MAEQDAAQIFEPWVDTFERVSARPAATSRRGRASGAGYELYTERASLAVR